MNDETIISVFREVNHAIEVSLGSELRWTTLKKPKRDAVKLAIRVFVLQYVTHRLSECETPEQIRSMARKRCEQLIRDADLKAFANCNDATFHDAYKTIERSAAVGTYSAGRRIGETAIAVDAKYVNGDYDESVVYRALGRASDEPESVIESIREAFQRYYSPSLG